MWQRTSNSTDGKERRQEPFSIQPEIRRIIHATKSVKRVTNPGTTEAPSSPSKRRATLPPSSEAVLPSTNVPHNYLEEAADFDMDVAFEINDHRLLIFDSLGMDLTWQAKDQLWLLYGLGSLQDQLTTPKPNQTKARYMPVQHQMNRVDCGFFSCAFVYELVNNRDPFFGELVCENV